MKTIKYTFENCLFSKNCQDRFLLVELGECDKELSISKYDVIDDWLGGDLEFEQDETKELDTGIYNGSLIVLHTKSPDTPNGMGEWDLEAWVEDIESKDEKDLKFLKEMGERIAKGERDSTQREFVMNMIMDWIKELENNLNNE